MNKHAHCSNCGRDVEFIIKKELIPINMSGGKFEFLAKIAHCRDCGEEIYVPEINDKNLEKAYETYREKLGLIKISEIRALLRKYNIGQKPLAALLGWGEATIIRYMQGEYPSREYSDRLKELMNPYRMKELFEKNRGNLSAAAVKKVESSLKSILTSSTPSENRDVVNVSRFFLNKVDVESGDFITPLRLQKLVYYAQSWSLSFLNRPLFNDDFEAWIHGPAAPSLDSFYEHFDNNPVPKVDNIDPKIFLDEEIELLEAVWKAYGKYSAKYLEDLVRSEEPWRTSANSTSNDEKCGNVIPKELIKSFYKSKINEHHLAGFQDIDKYIDSTIYL